jgi:hypothetical protein
MKQVCTAIIATVVIAAGLQRSGAALTRVVPDASSTASLLGIAVVVMLLGFRRVERLGTLPARV